LAGEEKEKVGDGKGEREIMGEVLLYWL